MKQSTANTVEVSNGIGKTIRTLENRFPELTFTVGFDQSDYIKSSIFSVAESALLGAILAIIVISCFEEFKFNSNHRYFNSYFHICNFRLYEFS